MSAKINLMPKQRCYPYLQIYLRSSQEVACTSEWAGRSAVCFQRRVMMTAQKAPSGPSIKKQLLTLGGRVQGAGDMKGSWCRRDHLHLQLD